MRYTETKIILDLLRRPWTINSYDCVRIAELIETQAKEIKELREALKETLAIAERNELGDYQLRARAALNGES